MADYQVTSFGDFYPEIRTYFSTNVQDFELFKRQGNGRKKMEFLLAHKEVTEALRRLRGDAPTANGIGKGTAASTGLTPRRTKTDAFKCSEKYPQLSAKVALQHSKKKGRHLVAKEKILPGKSRLIKKKSVFVD